jgi:hypothetical protein
VAIANPTASNFFIIVPVVCDVRPCGALASQNSNSVPAGAAYATVHSIGRGVVTADGSLGRVPRAPPSFPLLIRR